MLRLWRVEQAGLLSYSRTGVTIETITAAMSNTSSLSCLGRIQFADVKLGPSLCLCHVPRLHYEEGTLAYTLVCTQNGAYGCLLCASYSTNSRQVEIIVLFRIIEGRRGLKRRGDALQTISRPCVSYMCSFECFQLWHCGWSVTYVITYEV